MSSFSPPIPKVPVEVVVTAVDEVEESDGCVIVNSKRMSDDLEPSKMEASSAQTPTDCPIDDRGPLR